MNALKGIVLAGGTGSRLYPLTKVTNKHLLPVGRYPMIYHPLLRLREAGVRQIAVVTSPEHMGDVVNLLGSGRQLGVDLTYRVQDEAGGIAQAMGLCEDYSSGHPLVVVLGDNIVSESLRPEADTYSRQSGGARILLKKVPNPQEYGVPAFRGDEITSIVEKPDTPPSSYAVTGIYFFDEEVFDIVRGLSPSARGELEITDVNSAYVCRGKLTFGILQGWWGDAGTLEGWHEANRLAQDMVLTGR